jgi:hypothetical protein
MVATLQQYGLGKPVCNALATISVGQGGSEGNAWFFAGNGQHGRVGCYIKHFSGVWVSFPSSRLFQAFTSRY